MSEINRATTEFGKFSVHFVSNLNGDTLHCELQVDELKESEDGMFTIPSMGLHRYRFYLQIVDGKIVFAERVREYGVDDVYKVKRIVNDDAKIGSKTDDTKLA